MRYLMCNTNQRSKIVEGGGAELDNKILSYKNMLHPTLKWSVTG